MTDAPETDASFLALVSGASFGVCVIGIRHVAALSWEIRNSNFLQMWKKTPTNCIFKF